MNLPNITNIFSAMVDNPMVFLPLIAVVIPYSVAFLLYLYNPKNSNVYIFLSIPIVVSIICVSMNALCQLGSIINTGKITESLRLFQMFLLLSGMLMLCGITTKFKLKHIFLSHVISSILRGCFYYYCNHYDAGIIRGALHPTFEYLIVLALVSTFNYRAVLHFTAPKLVY